MSVETIVNPMYKYAREGLSTKYYKAQQNDVLHLGNKLKSKHLKWQNHKLKVNVAAQALSHSVSAAIIFLRKLKLQGFKDNKPSSDFILMMNNLFDMLNFKSKCGKHTKKPSDLEKFFDTEERIKKCIDCLVSLKDKSGVLLNKGPKKCFVTGFIYQLFQYSPSVETSCKENVCHLKMF